MLKSKQYFQPWRIFMPTVDRLKASPLWGWKSAVPKSKQDFQAQRIFRPRVKGLLESLHAKIQATFSAMVDFHSQEWETSEAFLLWGWKNSSGSEAFAHPPQPSYVPPHSFPDPLKNPLFPSPTRQHLRLANSSLLPWLWEAGREMPCLTAGAFT